MDAFTSAPAVTPSTTPTPPASSPSTSKPVTTTIFLSTYTTARTSLVSVSTASSPLTPITPSSPLASSTTTLLTSVSTPFDSSSSPVPTLPPNNWGWNCNTTNGSYAQLHSSESGVGCTETYVVPSSTKININLTEPTVTGTNNSEPTRTFTPGDFPGAAPRSFDTGFGGVAGWAGLMVVVGVWIGLI